MPNMRPSAGRSTFTKLKTLALKSDSPINNLKKFGNYRSLVDMRNPPSPKIRRVDSLMNFLPTLERTIALAFCCRDLLRYVFELMEHNTFGAQNTPRHVPTI